FDPITYIHLGLLVGEPDESTNESKIRRRSQPQRFTEKQGQYLAYIYAYTRLHRRPKPTCSNTSTPAHLRFTKWC
ncbi:MAG: hypothetical protein ACLPSW_25135, partial [Roseiarcus sp.]